MSWMDEEGVKSEPPDNTRISPDSNIEDTLAKFVIHLRAMGWSYNRIGLLFNRNHETLRLLANKTLSPDPKKQKNLGRKNKNKSRGVVNPENPA